MTEASTGTSNTDLFRFCPRLVPLSLASVFGLYALLVNFMCGNLRSCFKPNDECDDECKAAYVFVGSL